MGSPRPASPQVATFTVRDAKITSSASAEKRGKAVRFAMHNPDASEHSVGFSVLF